MLMKVSGETTTATSGVALHGCVCTGCEVSSVRSGCSDIGVWVRRRRHRLGGTAALGEAAVTEFPSGSKAFELAAKFCYGVKIDLSPSNVTSLRCTGESLEMTEEYS
ncbi:hypothetical protein AHAS_Ahas20G0332700 [Arachis hypogaea]